MHRLNPWQSYRQVATSTATPGQLVLMLYDGAIRFLEQARGELVASRVPKIHVETAITHNAGLNSIIENMIVPQMAVLSSEQQERLNAAIETVPGLSGHADRGGLLRWLQDLPDPRKVFLTHGEPDSAEAFADELRGSRDWDVHIPDLGETHELK